MFISKKLLILNINSIFAIELNHYLYAYLAQYITSSI